MKRRRVTVQDWGEKSNEREIGGRGKEQKWGSKENVEKKKKTGNNPMNVSRGRIKELEEKKDLKMEKEETKKGKRK